MEKNSRILIGNWKMNLEKSEALALCASITNKRVGSTSCVIGLAVPALYIDLLAQQANKDSRVLIGAQSTHWEDKGAFTGEISVPMLQSVGGAFALAGHSERRTYFGETNVTAAKRVRSLINRGCIGVLCIGETLSDREKGKTEDVLETQLRESFDELHDIDYSKLIIAYEPVWAIGTGKVANDTEISHAHAFINKISQELIETSLAILYGGSVSKNNFESILKIPFVNGGLVGGASLSEDSFIELINIACNEGT
jgi:triosephosphate isomerase (TIM)